MSKISGQFQDSCEISGISGQLGALHMIAHMPFPIAGSLDPSLYLGFRDIQRQM